MRTTSAAKSIGAAVLLCLALTACGGSKSGSNATPAPTPTPTPTEEITPELTPTPEITASPTPAPTATPAPTESPTPEITPTEVPSAVPSPTLPGCTKNAGNQQFFLNQAALFKWDVYCAVLPNGWSVKTGGASASYNNGGLLQVEYVAKTGKTFTLMEGNVCPPPIGCAAAGIIVGPANFGPTLSGNLFQVGTGWELWVTVSPKVQYIVTGDGMTQPQFVAYAAAIIKVG